MSDRPIIFSASMIRALLDGRKTQTRRLISTKGQANLFNGNWTDDYVLHPENAEWRGRIVRYTPGDRLWVKEAWRTADACDDLPPRDLGGEEAIWYEVDGHIQTWGWPEAGTKGRYRNARFMPRWASRLTLIVTDVRVQRLQEISEADAIEEGIEPFEGIDPECNGYRDYYKHAAPGFWLHPRASFGSLWNTIHGPNAWDKNPLVRALTFDVHRCNIDQMDDPA